MLLHLLSLDLFGNRHDRALELAAQRGVESPSVEILKICLTSTCVTCWQGVGQGFG